MVPDCELRLKKSYAELDELLKTHASFAEEEPYKAAKTVMEEAAPFLEKDV